MFKSTRPEGGNRPTGRHWGNPRDQRTEAHGKTKKKKKKEDEGSDVVVGDTGHVAKDT